MNRCDINHSFTAFGRAFIVFAKAAIAIKPRKSAFNDPSSSQKLKAFNTQVSGYDFKSDFQIFLNPVNEFAFVAAISPELLKRSFGFLR